MNIIDQTYYDIKLDEGDELGREILEIVNVEKKLNKNLLVLVHQVVQVDPKNYTVIVNILEM
ncbi:hypothetical protein H1D32_17560 [Anaerobacillus sp. CMMVII]|uniref:hypothetical protein n=1 Tax=Anaerobacillus sp. CMMVII TaxID=2755588 RepID=UPI0021B6E8C0|nr:hypothetical protein [Anaerobacillus sp. CMMVII]MCT8139355.1 hypothetical protein [Anaerobacillus sp. CMMVII]